MICPACKPWSVQGIAVAVVFSMTPLIYAGRLVPDHLEDPFRVALSAILIWFAWVFLVIQGVGMGEGTWIKHTCVEKEKP